MPRISFFFSGDIWKFRVPVRLFCEDERLRVVCLFEAERGFVARFLFAMLLNRKIVLIIACIRIFQFIVSCYFFFINQAGKKSMTNNIVNTI